MRGSLPEGFAASLLRSSTGRGRSWWLDVAGLNEPCRATTRPQLPKAPAEQLHPAQSGSRREPHRSTPLCSLPSCCLHRAESEDGCMATLDGTSSCSAVSLVRCVCFLPSTALMLRSSGMASCAFGQSQRQDSASSEAAARRCPGGSGVPPSRRPPLV